MLHFIAKVGVTHLFGQILKTNTQAFRFRLARFAGIYDIVNAGKGCKRTFKILGRFRQQFRVGSAKIEFNVIRYIAFLIQEINLGAIQVANTFTPLVDKVLYYYPLPPCRLKLRP